MRIPFLSLVAILISISSYSQSQTGPKVKNAKVSEKYANSTEVVYYINKEPLKGPQAKNAKIWDKDGRQAKVYIRKRREDLKGPKAKNKKIWKNPS